MELEDLTALVRRARGIPKSLTSEERERIYAKALELGAGTDRSASKAGGGGRLVVQRWRRLPAIAGALAITAAVVIALVVPSSGHHGAVPPPRPTRHHGVTVSNHFACPSTPPDSPVVAYVTYEPDAGGGPTYVAAVSLPSAAIRWTAKVPHDWPVDAIAAAPDGKTVYAVVGALRAHTELLSLVAASGHVRQLLALPGPPPSQAGLAISPDGREALVAQTGGIWTGSGPIGDSVTFVDLVKGEVRTVVDVGTAIGVGFSPDSQTAYVTDDGASSNGITVLDAATGRVTGRVAFPSTQPGIEGEIVPGALAVSPTGNYVLVANAGLDLMTPEQALNVVRLHTPALENPIKLPKSGGSYTVPVVVACNGKTAFDIVYGVDVVRIDPATHRLWKLSPRDSTAVDAIAATTGGRNLWLATATGCGHGSCPNGPVRTEFLPLNPRSNRAGAPTKSLPWSVDLMALGSWIPARS